MALTVVSAEERLAASVENAIRRAATPLLERIASLEAQLKSVGDVRDRVVTLETKAAQPPAPIPVTLPVDLAPVLERVAAAEARLSVLGDLRDRVVTVETKAALTPAAPSVVFDAAPLLAKFHTLEVQLALAQERIAVIDTKTATADEWQIKLQALMDQIVIRQEMKSFETTPLLGSIAELTKDMTSLRERVAVAEVRALVPGPAGKDGANGADGLNGKDGADGLGFDDLMTVQQDERSFSIKAVRGDRFKDIGTARFPVQIQRGVYIEGKSYEHGDVVTWGGSQWHANVETTMKPGDGSKDWVLVVKRGRDGKDGRDGHDLVPVVSVGSRA